jgi:hypothetical protein
VSLSCVSLVKRKHDSCPRTIEADTILVSANGANFGYNTAWLFAVLGLIVSIGAIWLCPETARRSPAELDELYEHRVPAWKMRKYVTDVQRDQDARLAARIHGPV